MKGNILAYKGYHTKIEFDKESGVLHGKIEGIKDLVNFESDSAKEIENEFHLAVDDYLEMCREIRQEPDKEYSGLFNVRIKPELHKDLALKAFSEGLSLNAEVEMAIENYLYKTAYPPQIHIGKIEFHRVPDRYSPGPSKERTIPLQGDNYRKSYPSLARAN